MASITVNNENCARFDENAAEVSKASAVQVNTRNPLAPINPTICNNQKLKRQVKAINEPSKVSECAQPSKQSAKPIASKVAKTDKTPDFEIFCDEVVEETQPTKKEEKEVCDENDKENVKCSRSESFIELNALSIDEGKKNDSASDEQVANIMCMVNEDEATRSDTSTHHSFDEFIFEKCKEYSHEIYVYLLRCEVKFRPDPDYMPKQQDINTKMRSILVDWMVEVADEYKLADETLFLAVGFVDRFLSTMCISRQMFQLLGTAALFISSKYEEIYPPDVHEFVYITDDTYTKLQVLNMEKLILKVLQFDVSSPTSHYFLRKYLTNLQIPKKVSYIAEYFCYLTLLEDDPFLRFYPSEIAICSIILALHTYGLESVDLAFYKNTLFEIESREPSSIDRIVKSRQLCVDALHKMQRFAPQHSQQAICQKFSDDKYACVALMTAKDAPPNVKRYFT